MAATKCHSVSAYVAADSLAQSVDPNLLLACNEASWAFWHNGRARKTRGICSLGLIGGVFMRGNILITGAAQRVGLFCALALQQAGYQVIATYRREKPGVATLRQAGVICLPLAVDAQDDLAAQVCALTEQLAPYGKLRALIHNASSWAAESEPAADLYQTLRADAAVFDEMMQIHAKLPYLLTRALAPMLAGDALPADVIAISDFAVNTGSCNHMAYAASKAALENLVLSQARLLAPRVKVNAIAPSLLMFNDGDDEAYKAYTLQKSLMGIEPGPQEVLNAIEFILQSRYITGRVVALDGGRHLKLP